jgi:glycerol uptake facilitator-like aquaporin
MYTPAVTEFLGTSLLLGAIAFTNSPLLIVAAFAIAIAFAKSVSGAHINPAVTIMQVVAGKMSVSRATSYILAQLGAGVAIGFLATLM